MRIDDDARIAVIGLDVVLLTNPAARSGAHTGAAMRAAAASRVMPAKTAATSASTPA